jgi:hypothetical protein
MQQIHTCHARFSCRMASKIISWFQRNREIATGDVRNVAPCDKLEDYCATWNRKPVLRLIYDDFYDRLAAACRPGVTIEIGGGIGNLKRRLSDVVATDIQSTPWLDCVADAQRLPFAGGSATNIVMVDVLHPL